MAQIKTLTQAQLDGLGAIRDKWLAIGLSTERTNKALFLEQLPLAYKAAKLSPPERVVWVDSPLQGQRAAQYLQDSHRMPSMTADIWLEIQHLIHGHTDYHTSNAVAAAFADELYPRLLAAYNQTDIAAMSLKDYCYSRLLSDKCSSFGLSEVVDHFLDTEAPNRANTDIVPCVYGSHDADWLSFYEGVAGLGVDCSEIQPLSRIAESCGWWWPFENIVVVSDRPEVTHFDDDNQIHSETGPAIRYTDGFSVHAFHGLIVPKAWIEDKESVDPADVIKNPNVELVSAGCQLIGWPRMMSVLKSKTIHDSGSEDMGSLIELTLPGLPEPGLFLKARCPRNGIIVEEVPRVSDIDNLPITTALHAQAWRIGDPQSEYEHPTKRT